MNFLREFRFPVDRLLPGSQLQALKELLRKSETRPGDRPERKRQEQAA
jgi:hypothetical protein